MKTLAISVALLLSAGAQAGYADRAALVGHHFQGSVEGAPVLVCVYSGALATFEIVSRSGTCAPFIEVR